MSEIASESPYNAQVRVMQIINAALVMGALNFMCVAGFIRVSNGDPPAPVPTLSYILLAISLMAVVSHFIVPNLVAARLRRRIVEKQIQADSSGQPLDETHALWAAYRTYLLIGLALLESASFMLFIAFILEGIDGCLLVGALVVAGMALKFPTLGRVEAWVGAQKEAIYQEQS